MGNLGGEDREEWLVGVFLAVLHDEVTRLVVEEAVDVNELVSFRHQTQT